MKSVAIMKKFFSGLLLTVVGAWTGGAAPADIYINQSPANSLPQVDATIFVNRSTIDLFTTLPYRAQNVQFWTNTGLMSGSPGFQFQYDRSGKTTGRRTRANSKDLTLPSTSFHNDGDISVSSLLSINANSIFNSGKLEAGEAGRIVILSTNGTADLSRSSIRVGPATGLNVPCDFPSLGGSNFFPDVNITDLYWGAGRNNFLGTNGALLTLSSLPSAFGGNLTLPFPRTPFHQVVALSRGRAFTNTVALPGGLNFGGGCSTNYEIFVHTNFNFSADGLPETVFTMVFTPTKTTLAASNLDVAVRFISDFGPAGQAFAPVVEFRSISFDIVEQQLATNYVTFIDTTGSKTNVILARPFNIFGLGGTTALNTRRPSTYNIIDGRYCFFDTAEETNSVFDPGIFNGPEYLTNRASTIYAAYSGEIGANPSTATLTPTIIQNGFFALGANPAATDPTNFSGKVEIVANGLNLDGTRIRAENFISIKANNLTSNFVAQIDAPFIDYNVASSNSPLIISNLAPASVNRLGGQISAWSSVWSATVTNDLGQTNSVRFHVLLLDNCLRAEQPVTMNRFSVRTPSLTIVDDLLINSGLLLNAPTLTIESNSTVALPQRADWAFTNVQNLVNFTNHGTVNVQGGAYFGDFNVGHITVPKKKKGRRRPAPVVPAPLNNFFNDGFITASSFFVRATNVVFTGQEFVPSLINANIGVLAVTASRIVVSNAFLIAGADAEFHANDLHISGSFLNAGTADDGFGRSIRGALTLDATNSLGDDGLSSGNLWQVTSGVRVPRFPTLAGDLLGTQIYSTAGSFWESPIIWPARNLGPVPAGFTNNLAVGRLTLDGRQGNLFRFRSPTTNTAIYVDYLELLNTATNYNFNLGVSPGFTIYFADANISPDKLDAQGGGRIKWVSSYAGAQSSTNLLYPNGLTYTFNAGLVRSVNRDDDGDGFLNGEDCTPIIPPGEEANTNLWFGSLCPVPFAAGTAKALGSAGINLQIALAPGGGAVVLDWDAAANSANTVEFTETLSGAAWQTLTNFINGPTDTRVTVRDAAAAPARVYRIRVDAAKP